MTTFASGVFYGLALGGTLAALAGVAIFTVKSIRLRDPDVFPEAIPWGYMGVGLAFAGFSFWLSRTLSSGDIPELSDVRDLALVLGVASAGFGVIAAWAKLGERWGTGWAWPLILSTLMGVSGGLSAIAF